MDPQRFLDVVDATPLVSIDFVVRNAEGRVLLGERVNRPARRCWFVPGGRIRKDEPVADAMRRISRVEFGVAVAPEAARLLGVYDHFYPDNFLGAPGVSTHYVVLGYECRLPDGVAVEPDDQHAALRWWDVDALLAHAGVHENTKRYFRS